MSKILLVDDETEFVEMLAFRLAKAGYEVLQAYDGEEGLLKARAEHPDLVLLDIWMPKKDGFEVCRELKSSPETAGIPVIFLTASTATQTTDQIRGTGAVDFMRKPFDPAQMMAKIKTTLEANKHV
jgi:DNA-binding response OmpR family regulator